MDRREFLKIAACAGVSTLLLPGCGSQTTPPPQAAQAPAPAVVKAGFDTSAYLNDLVIAQGNDPEGLLERGFKALGGIQNFVKPGHTVVLKPNFSTPRMPEEACTTNPLLVAGLVKMCLKAGAKAVKVIDYTFSNPAICLEKTGIKSAVAAAGGQVYTLNNGQDKYFQTVKIGGKVLTDADFSKDVLEADVFINMPILKHHNITDLTMGLKNMMGLVWDRGFFHSSRDLDRCIAELASFRRPSLTIMDAIRGITDKGPYGPGPIKEYNQVVFGVDPVAVDAYGATLFGTKPVKIDHLRHAGEMGLGKLDWEKLAVKRV